MSDEILINITPMEARVAVVENGVVQEVHVERSRQRGIVGNIYKGKVSRVLPGMQAAFVDIGLERSGFLALADISQNGQQKVENISELLQEGQLLVVQVVKDPIGSKGARLTTCLSLPSRYLVYTPGTGHIGVSLKVESEDERERLKQLVQNCLALEQMPLAEHGFIVRTAAETIGEAEMRADIKYLHRLWRQVQEQIAGCHASCLLYEELALPMRALRDFICENTEKVRIDSRETFLKARRFVDELMPELSSLLEHYPGERPIFDLYNIEDEIQSALQPRVPLKSGGYLVIESTESMITVDVNTGAFVGHRTLEETIFKTNLEAAMAIARHLRLRNLGGIIIIDFIDMRDEEHRRQVIRTLENWLGRDHAKTHLVGISELGLVQMTRKRTRESLAQTLCSA